MAAPRKYPDELRERAIRMTVDLRRDPVTCNGALSRVAMALRSAAHAERRRTRRREYLRSRMRSCPRAA